MKFICNQREMTKALNIVSKAVSTRTTIPVLKGILLDAALSGRLMISASDFDISIQDSIAVDVKEPGSVIVTARLFEDIVRKLPGMDIEIESTNDNKVTIRSMNSVFNIVGMAADEFPVINQIDDQTETIQIDRKIFREMIEKTSFAASIDESRGIITGLLIEIEDNMFNMVAIDGYRVAIARRPMPENAAHEFVISARIMNDIAKILSDDNADDQGVLYLSDKKAVMRFGTVEAEMKLLAGKFVPYRDIIPKESDITLKIERTLLMESVERASLLAKIGKNNLIKMHIKKDVITLTSDSEEGSAEERIVANEVKASGDAELLIGFNGQYLMDALKAIDDEVIEMGFRSKVDPCVIRPIEGNDYTYLILPVRI